jgi:type IX secretion system PorP/SprF family membrane protein
MKKAFFTICLLAITTLGFGQYSNNLPNFTDNPLLYNPAYTGITGTLDASILHYRTSGVLLSSGNSNLSLLSLSSPIGKGNWSVGGNLVYENIHFIDFSSVDATVAYHKNLKNGAKLSFGALTSLERHHFDINPTIGAAIDDSGYAPQFGLGAIYQTKLGYLSISAPDMFVVPFTYEDENGNEYSGESRKDLYISAGLNLTMFDNKLQILPSAVYHKRQSTELQRVFEGNDLEIGASFVLFEKVWVSGAYHSAVEGFNRNISVDAADIRVGVNLKNGLRISGKLEFPLSQLRNGYNSNTNGGIMLGYRISKGSENLNLGRRHFL